MLDKILAKLTSGKFLFTMIAGIVFLVLAINKTMPIDKVYELILIVVYAYFSRKPDDTQPNGKDKTL